MSKRRPFRPASVESLENRVVPHSGVEHVSSLHDVFNPQMGRTLTADYVFANHLSRREALEIVSGQVRVAFLAFRSGLHEGIESLTSSSDIDAFETDIEALCEGLTARCTEILSTSPRAQPSLVPFCENQLRGVDPKSLSSQLKAVASDFSRNPVFDVSSSTLGIAQTLQKRLLFSIATFTIDPYFRFPEADGSDEPNTPSQPSPPQETPAQPTPTQPTPTRPIPTQPAELTRSELLTPISLAVAHSQETAQDGMHIHPNLTIIIDGQVQMIPTGIGIESNGLLAVHTHDDSGRLHVEFPSKRIVRLRDFFTVWREATGNANAVYTNQNILGHQTDSTHRITMKVNNEATTEYEDLILVDHDDIVITYGPINS